MDIRRLGATAGLLGAAALVAALGAGPLLVTGADHLDAPGVKADKRTDITDVYAFASQGGTTLALNINPLHEPRGHRRCAPQQHRPLPVPDRYER